MTLPTVTVRIAFASNPYVASPSWTDVSGDVMSVNIQRGRFHELDRIEAGTAVIVLKNRHGKYWPNNTGSAYYPNVLPVKRVNVRATYGATTYDLFTGFSESWEPGWQSRGGVGPIMTLSCVDLIKNLSRFLVNGAGHSQETPGDRVDNILDDLAWGAIDRSVDTGQSEMKATGAMANINAMDHLFSVQESEMGLFWVRGDGYAIFQDRHARLKGSYVTSQATFGNDPAENKYADVEFSYDEQYLYNDVRITRSGGTEQAASDSTSQTAYGTRSLARTGLLMTTDLEAADQASYLLSRFKDPHMRVKNITVLPQADAANLWPKVLGYEISTRITVRLDQASIDGDYHIEGINHVFDAENGTWKTRWELSDTNSQAYWILDTSVLDTDTRLAY